MKDSGQQVVLVTGGSRGIGRAISEAFADSGYAVVINCNESREAADALMQELSTKTYVSVEQANVADPDMARQMIENVISKFGKIDVLVNNAGVARDGFLMLMPDEDWQDVIATNLTGVFNCSRAVTGHMISQRSGSIINVSSLSGVAGLSGQSNYAAAKGGVIAFTRALSKELAQFGIRVNAVAPGVITTSMVEGLGDKTKEDFMAAIPMKRFGRPEEVASVVRFLASADASYITGETICIAGGLH